MKEEKKGMQRRRKLREGERRGAGEGDKICPGPRARLGRLRLHVKGKGLDTCYSATYMSQTRDQQRGS